jgi:prevent-host-death family protein
MSTGFQKIDDLPRRNATQVKNKWGDLVRTVHKTGSVAVTNHDRLELVVMDADHYREMAALAEGVQKHRETALAELAAEFDRHLAELQSAETRDRIEKAMASHGEVPLPKAGPSF